MRKKAVTRSLLAVAAFAFVVFAVVGIASATGTLDQEQTLLGTVARTGGQQWSAQTYTAGITGNQDQVDLFLSRTNSPGPLTVQIRTTAGGVPTSTVLGTAIVNESSIPVGGNWDSVLFSPPVPVIAGTQYAIVLGAPAGNADPNVSNVYAWIRTDNSYAAGEAVYSNDSGLNWAASPNIDHTFKTYVSDVLPCQPGYYSATGNEPCTAAAPGYFVSGSGATAAAVCGAGTFSQSSASTSCSPCPTGTSSLAAASSCTPVFVLIASATPAAGGTVTGAGTYFTGSVVSVTQSPNSGYVFLGWSGNCAGTGSCSVSMTGAKSVTATYALQAVSKPGCESDGWTTLVRADGSVFKNQGDCIQYVNTGK